MRETEIKTLYSEQQNMLLFWLNLMCAASNQPHSDFVQAIAIFIDMLLLWVFR